MLLFLNEIKYNFQQQATNKTDMDYRTITTAVSPKSFSNPKTNGKCPSIEACYTA